jgi:hypothetical protein
VVVILPALAVSRGSMPWRAIGAGTNVARRPKEFVESGHSGVTLHGNVAGRQVTSTGTDTPNHWQTLAGSVA